MVTSTIILAAGSMFILWLGERITDKGIGNGTVSYTHLWQISVRVLINQKKEVKSAVLLARSVVRKVVAELVVVKMCIRDRTTGQSQLGGMNHQPKLPSVNPTDNRPIHHFSLQL